MGAVENWVQKVKKKATKPSSEANLPITQQPALFTNEAKPAEEIIQSTSTSQFWRKKRSREAEVEGNTTENTESKTPKK